MKAKRSMLYSPNLYRKATPCVWKYGRNINMNFDEKIKTTYKEVTENSDASSKNLKSELKNKLRRRRNVVEKSQSQSRKFDATDIRL